MFDMFIGLGFEQEHFILNQVEARASARLYGFLKHCSCPGSRYSICVCVASGMV